VITVVDLGISNLQSVLEGFRRVGATFEVTKQPDDVERAQSVVLPGVGAFRDGMRALHEHGLVDSLRRHALERKRPLTGICLGMQLLADGSEEHGSHEGLGLVPGRSVRLQPSDGSLRVPNMGWCDVTVRRPGTLLAEDADGRAFYFAHSYHLEVADTDDIAATLDYSGPIVAAIERANITGVQFHPEKSQDAGLDVLAAFARTAAA
jgi:glutamine amidotransferase